MTDYLSNNFSPSMIPEDTVALLKRCQIIDIPYHVESIVRREVPAAILSALIGRRIKVAKEYLVSLKYGDTLYCLIPNFGAADLYDFNKEEIVKAGYKCFIISVHKNFGRIERV